MAIVAQLDVLLNAVTKKFDSGLSKSQSRLAAFSKASIGFGLAAGTAGIALSKLSSEMEKLDEIGKQAQRIGETTEAISRLRFAADLTGAGADKLSKGLDVMQKRLGEAARGSGAAVKALDDLGLSATELINLRPSEAFHRIADATSKLGTQAEKAAVTANIFSRANQALVNTLDAGSKGLAAMAAESDKFGNTVSGKAAEDAAKFNDAMLRLNKSFAGFGRTAAVAFAGPMADFLDELAKTISLLTSIETKGEKIGETIARWLTPLVPFTKLLNAINESFDKGPPRSRSGQVGTSLLEDFLRLHPSLRSQDRGFATFGAGRQFGTAPLPPEPDLTPRPGPLSGGRVTRFGDDPEVRKQTDLTDKQLKEQQETNRLLRNQNTLAPAAL